MSKLKCAVIGVGNMGRHHARIYSQLAQLVAVCDLDANRGQDIAQQYGARYYQSVSTLLANETLDAISVAVPTKYHYQTAKQTLETGIPTLVEKPIANTIEEAQKLISVAKKHGTALMVGHIERFNPVIQSLKKQLQKKALGEIISIVAIRSGINPPREKQSHVGLDLTIHDIDTCLFLLEEKPKKVTVYTQKITPDQRADSISAIAQFSSAVANFSTNWLSPIKVRKLFLTGSRGYAEVDYVRQILKIFNRPPAVKTANFRELQQLVVVKPRRIRVPRKEPLRNELEFFLRHLDQPQIIRSQTNDALTALKIVLQ